VTIPWGDAPRYLDLLIRFRVQLEDAINGDRVPVPLGAVLSRSKELTVALERTSLFIGLLR